MDNTKRKVVFIQPILPNYRQSVVECLINSDQLDCFFVTSSKYLTNNAHKFNNPRVIDNHIFKGFRLIGHTFYWLKGANKTITKIKPNVIVITGYDPHMIHTFWLFIKYRFFSNTKVLWWSQGTIGNQGTLGTSIRSWFYRRAHSILAYSSDAKNRLEIMGVKPLNIQVINNSIGSSEYGFKRLDIETSKRNQQPSKAIKLICVGKLNYVKKIDRLVDVVKVLVTRGVEVECHIVGTGEQYDEIKEKIDQLSVEKQVILHGAMFGKDLDNLFLESDIYVLPGAVGLSIVHGFSYGLPIVTTDDFASHRPEIELLEAGKNGYTYKDSSIDDMADKILLLYEELSTRRVEIANDCIESIQKFNYLPEQVYNRILEKLKALDEK